MFKNGKWIKTMGDCTELSCNNHSYRWSGGMPCTGTYYCVFCGKPEAE